MKISHEKTTHLSHVILNALERSPAAHLVLERNQVRLKVIDLLRVELRRDEEIERKVRTKIVGQKRSVPEGSQEWDILFRKYYEEEIGKLRSVSG